MKKMGRGRAPCCDKSKVRTGPWSPAEDLRLMNYIQKHGHPNWRALPKQAGLLRCGKSCRLRWINYLRPDVKRGNFTPEEEQTMINLHARFGNKWSKIASYLPGRTDNEIKNVWNTHLKKRLETSKGAVGVGHSASSSCSSSSDENTETLLGDQGVQDSEVKKSNESPDEFVNTSDNESKQTAASDSPSSSFVSKSGGNSDSYGEMEIPSDSDFDFWDLLDSLGALQSTKTENNGGEQDANLSISSEKFEGQELELGKWLRFLENELGLTSDGD